MLILQRKAGEAICAGDVIIRVLDIHGQRVRLGLIAGPHVHIVRAELVGADREPRAIQVFTHEEVLR